MSKAKLQEVANYKDNHDTIKVGGLLDYLEERFPCYDREELRDFLMEVQSGKHPPEEDDTQTKQCPKCHIWAEGEEQIDELFGWRYEGQTPQSWCKTCRNS